MTYDEIREQLPPILTIKTLGGRRFLSLHNPPIGELRVINSKGGRYPLTRQDFVGAKAIRSANYRNPWRSALYTDLGEYFSYSLIHAAALLRHVEEGGRFFPEADAA